MKSKLLVEWFSFDKQEEFELLETERGDIAKGDRAQNAEAGAAVGDATIAMQAGIAEDLKLSKKLKDNLDTFRSIFKKSSNDDVIIRPFSAGGRVNACVIYMSGMADSDVVSDFILKQAMRENALAGCKGSPLDHLISKVIAIGEMSEKTQVVAMVDAVLGGMSLLMVDGEARGAIFETRGFAHRPVDKPEMEKGVRSPNEAFVESIRTNITLLRRIVRTPDFVVEMKPIGGDNNTRCALAYRRDKANPELLKEIEKRLSQVKVPYMQGGGMLEQAIQSRKYAPLNQLLSTERPDKAASMIMQGHVVIISEGMPYVSAVPATIPAMMTAPDDIYVRPVFGSGIRALRWIGFLLAVYLPGVYTAILMYHQGTLSIEVINTIMASRRMVSIPIYMEVLLLLSLLLLIRESGLRLPGALGQSISVVAALVLGQASVDANIVSTTTLIIVALTGLSTYIISNPSLQFSVSVFRVLFLAAGTILGLMGIAALSAIGLVYMCSLKSFGVPMLAPIAPKTFMHKRPILRGQINDNGDNLEDYTNTKEGK